MQPNTGEESIKIAKESEKLWCNNADGWGCTAAYTVTSVRAASNRGVVLRPCANGVSAGRCRNAFSKSTLTI